MEAKKIIITGSATRIGAEIAKSLASYDTQITLHYNKSSIEVKKLKNYLENLGSKVFLIKADLSKLMQTKKIVPFAYKMMKGLDCLINNASVFEKDDPLQRPTIREAPPAPRPTAPGQRYTQ